MFLCQAFKRHAELGYWALSTGLANVTLPGNIPFEEWDFWHTLIVTDELSFVARTACNPDQNVPGADIGIHRGIVGSRRGK